MAPVGEMYVNNLRKSISQVSFMRVIHSILFNISILLIRASHDGATGSLVHFNDST